MRRLDFVGLASLVGLVAWGIISSGTAVAQEPRYELGVRVRRFEQLWEVSSIKQRAASTSAMERAVTSFFSLQLAEAGARLDEAWFALSEDAPSEAYRWGASQSVGLETRWFDTSATELKVSLRPFYETSAAAPEAVRVEWVLQSVAGEQELAKSESDLATALEGHVLPVKDLPPGDHRLVVTLRFEQGFISLPGAIVSCSERRDERMAALNEASKELRAEIDTTTGTATLGNLRPLLGRIAAGDELETDYPADRLLTWCEQVIEDRGDAAELVRRNLAIDQWITLFDGERRLVVRMRGPAEVSAPLPVLIALHGAGGSENMFFETYGAGRLVDLAVERGWLVVAPRQALTGIAMDLDSILSSVEALVPIDRERVFVAGHSMGAMQAIRQTSRYPELVTAVAAVGGGGDPGRDDRLNEIPFFVAAGDRDFGRRGAMGLVESLRRQRARCEYIEYEATEHMVVMQASLDDLFEFFDRHAVKN